MVGECFTFTFRAEAIQFNPIDYLAVFVALEYHCFKLAGTIRQSKVNRTDHVLIPNDRAKYLMRVHLFLV